MARPGSKTRTLWHAGFYQLTSERRPPAIELRFEVPLAFHPGQMDLLIRRRAGEPRRDGEARVLRGLWPLLGDVAIADFKSPSRGFRASELVRLLYYGARYHTANFRDLSSAKALNLVLFVPRVNKALRHEIDCMGCKLQMVSEGYARLDGPMMYTTYIALMDQVAEAENDEYLRIFTEANFIRDPQARRWMEQWFIEKSDMQNIKDMEGYDEIRRKLLDSYTLEERLAGITLEERLAGITLEERLVGITLEERLVGLTEQEREALLALLSKQTKH